MADGLAASEIVYDVRGNTVRLGDMQFSYDAANRHVGTTYDDGTAVRIVRDASGRIVSRINNGAKWASRNQPPDDLSVEERLERSWLRK
ncbi:MAG: hypothetical protein ACRDWD_09145 [Acidimicrobiia bacterium]